MIDLILRFVGAIKMAKKKLDDKFICPACGKKTIQEVEYWANGDFLAVHSRKFESRGGSFGSYIIEVFTGCDKIGRLPR